MVVILNMMITTSIEYCYCYIVITSIITIIMIITAIVIVIVFMVVISIPMTIALASFDDEQVRSGLLRASTPVPCRVQDLGLTCHEDAGLWDLQWRRKFCGEQGTREFCIFQRLASL